MPLFIYGVTDLTTQESSLKKEIAQLQQVHLLAFRREVSIVVSANAATKVLSFILSFFPSFFVSLFLLFCRIG